MKSRRTVLASLLTLTLLATIPSLAKDKDTTPGRLLTGKVMDKQDNLYAGDTSVGRVTKMVAPKK